jgi:hypothetical protein
MMFGSFWRLDWIGFDSIAGTVRDGVSFRFIPFCSVMRLRVRRENSSQPVCVDSLFRATIDPSIYNRVD